MAFVVKALADVSAGEEEEDVNVVKTAAVEVLVKALLQEPASGDVPRSRRGYIIAHTPRTGTLAGAELASGVSSPPQV